MQSTFQLTEKQAEYIRNANHRWNVACGAVRAGKSFCQIAYCIPSRLLERKGKKGLRVIIGATKENIERNILTPMRDLYGVKIASEINSRNWCTILGERVYCIGAEKASQVSKLRGSEIAYCALDEATDVNEEVFELLKSRLSLPYSCCDATTNPSYPQHWFKQFIDSAADGVDIYCQTYSIYDNPFLPEDYVRNLEAEYKNTIWFMRYIRGEWCVAAGLVYDFGEDNITDNAPLDGEWYISVDYGTMNPFSAGLWCLRGDRAVRVSEYYYSGRTQFVPKTDEEYCDEVAKLAGDRRIKRVVVDPSAASFIAALRKRGFTVIQANNEVMDGIRRVAEYLRSGNIKIHRSCGAAIQEFGLYRWDEKKTEDAVIKDNDHCLTGDTLVMTGDGEIPIRDLVGASGLVWSYENGTPVLMPFHDVRMTREKARVLKITTADGKTVRCTEDHPILTADGWKKAGDLKYGDEIIDIGEGHD